AEEADPDDMFAEQPDTVETAGAACPKPLATKGDGEEAERQAAHLKRRGQAGALADAYDDHEGYYNFQVGEIMEGRYEVFASNGKGVFSIVVRARDLMRKNELKQHPEVAIKLIRSNETMYKAAQTELAVLRKLGAADPDNKKHTIKLLRHFDYRNHMCLVFENMEMNLRDLTKKLGRNKGLNVEAVQLFTCQLLIALRHLKKNGVLHADIKPDNILINHRRNKVKICDFGSAMLAGENDITPYLVSRFYRPPEVVLGMKYDYAMDMWSIGCVIYELFTSRILFPGHSNNEMLKLMMDVKGAFTKKMLRKCAFAEKHFDMHDPACSFVYLEDDPITKSKVRKLMAQPAPKASFSTLLARGGHNEKDRTKVALLADLLDKMMMLEPERRIDPDSALRHPFVKDYLPKKP
ncbi:protein kinase domain-containing protein, partial [Haematococcus lacustris]